MATEHSQDEVIGLSITCVPKLGCGARSCARAKILK
jgi:hypothetical protein